MRPDEELEQLEVCLTEEEAAHIQALADREGKSFEVVFDEVMDAGLDAVMGLLKDNPSWRPPAPWSPIFFGASARQ